MAASTTPAIFDAGMATVHLALVLLLFRSYEEQDPEIYIE
jgi:hypothetical protein